MLRCTCALLSIAFALSMLAATEAAATTQRTFVASNGNDANPCSLVLPCRTFGAAIMQTGAGGEVIVLDSAGYGPVTIAQDVSIIAPEGVYAGVSVPSGTGIAITGISNVLLRGLTINGTGGGTGIHMTANGSLTIDRCVISNFISFGNGRGVSIEANVRLIISATELRAIDFPVVVGFGSTATITSSRFINGVWSAIWLEGGAAGTTTSIFVDDTVIAGSHLVDWCVTNRGAPGAIGNISATRVTVTHCVEAFHNDPQGAGTTTVSNSMVSGSGIGFNNASGTFLSLGNNHVSGNTNDKAGVVTTILTM